MLGQACARPQKVGRATFETGAVKRGKAYTLSSEAQAALSLHSNDVIHGATTYIRRCIARRLAAHLDGKPGGQPGRDGADLVHAEPRAFTVGYHVYNGTLVGAAEALGRGGGGKSVGIFDQSQALD